MARHGSGNRIPMLVQRVGFLEPLNGEQAVAVGQDDSARQDHGHGPGGRAQKVLERPPESLWHVLDGNGQVRSATVAVNSLALPLAFGDPR